eukprot:gnl/Chilomastix_caulleri/976.p1 GENE.gnl/Chilomastix_caulleri/976~~gnl/Chilomastix_caulleri/976.p1  ORF type:complete len:149 (+),score=38.92 gnl/Chilomastix_caulleri/976:108-554(+)
MAGAKGKGGKKGRRTKGTQNNDTRELIFAEDEQTYGVITKPFGNSRVEVKCYDSVTRACKIAGKLRKRVWMGVGDLVLVSIRDFEPEKGDVILKYTDDEAKLLKKYKEIDVLPSEVIDGLNVQFDYKPSTAAEGSSDGDVDDVDKDDL